MLSKLRQRYWIPCADALDKKVIHYCTTCRRVNSNAGTQKVADLPIDRSTLTYHPLPMYGLIILDHRK